MNTYLIVSETNYFINIKIKEITKDISNVINFNMDDNSIDEILNEASYFSMFEDKKCLIVKNAKFFSSSRNSDSNKAKEDSSKLLNYLANENKNTIIIFILNDKVDTKKKIYSVLKNNNNVFTFNNMTKTEMKNELKRIIVNNKYDIDDKSLWYIINNSLNNFDLAVNEINKIFIYYSKPCFIEYDDVLKITCKTIIDNNFKLIDSIIVKDLNNSLKYLDDLKILKVEPTIIIALLYREFRLMLSIILYEKSNISKDVILNNLHLALWQYDKIKNEIRLYTEDEIKKEIICLSDIDYGLKSGEMSKETVLLNYILKICK